MAYLRKVTIKGKGYYYLFHTVREGSKYRKASKYIGKEKPTLIELEKAKQELLSVLHNKRKSQRIERPRIHLVEALKGIQREHGYLPERKLRELSENTGISPLEIYSAATFYSMLSVRKKGKSIVRVCDSPSCYLNGSENILEEAKRILGIGIGETTKDGKYSLELTSCIGCCNKPPAIMINDELITNLTKEKLKGLLR